MNVGNHQQRRRPESQAAGNAENRRRFHIHAHRALLPPKLLLAERLAVDGIRRNDGLRIDREQVHGHVQQILVRRRCPDGFVIVKRGTLLHERLFRGDDLADAKLIVKSAAHSHRDDVPNAQRSKRLHGIRRLGRAAPAIQKAQLPFRDLPYGAAIQKARERLRQLHRIVTRREILRPLTHEKHDCRLRQVHAAFMPPTMHLLGGGNHRF